MNVDEIRRVAREAAERSAGAQGLPLRITDRTVVKRIATLLRDEVEAEADAAAWRAEQAIEDQSDGSGLYG